MFSKGLQLLERPGVRELWTEELYPFQETMHMAGLLSPSAPARALEGGQPRNIHRISLIFQRWGGWTHFEEEEYGTRQKVPNPKLSSWWQADGIRVMAGHGKCRKSSGPAQNSDSFVWHSFGRAKMMLTKGERKPASAPPASCWQLMGMCGWIQSRSTNFMYEGPRWTEVIGFLGLN